MTQELNDKELEQIVGGMNDDGRRYNVHCKKREGTVVDDMDFKGVKGTEAKDMIVSTYTSEGFICKVTNA